MKCGAHWEGELGSGGRSTFGVRSGRSISFCVLERWVDWTSGFHSKGCGPGENWMMGGVVCDVPY